MELCWSFTSTFSKGRKGNVQCGHPGVGTLWMVRRWSTGRRGFQKRWTYSQKYLKHPQLLCHLMTNRIHQIDSTILGEACLYELRKECNTNPRGRMVLTSCDWRNGERHWSTYRSERRAPPNRWNETLSRDTKPSMTPQQRVNSSPISTTIPVVRPRAKHVSAASLYIISPGTLNFSKRSSENLAHTLTARSTFPDATALQTGAPRGEQDCRPSAHRASPPWRGGSSVRRPPSSELNGMTLSLTVLLKSRTSGDIWTSLYLHGKNYRLHTSMVWARQRQ